MKNRRSIRVKPLEDRPIRVDLNGKNFIEVALVIDISINGFAICTPHHFKGYDLDEDCKVSFSLTLPTPYQYHFSGTGILRHHNKDIVGVAFYLTKTQDMVVLREYILTTIYEQEKSNPNFKERGFFDKILHNLKLKQKIAV